MTPDPVRVSGAEKYSVQFYWDGEIQFYSSAGTKNTVLEYYWDGNTVLQTKFRVALSGSELTIPI